MSEEAENKAWVEVGAVDDFAEGLGSCVLHEGKQIAIFRLENDGGWHATQNECPHEQKMVLSRGLTGDAKGEPKITCPLHKRSFSLKSGEFIGDEEMDCLTVYPVKAEDGKVFIQV